MKNARRMLEHPRTFTKRLDSKANLNFPWKCIQELKNFTVENIHVLTNTSLPSVRFNWAALKAGRYWITKIPRLHRVLTKKEFEEPIERMSRLFPWIHQLNRYKPSPLHQLKSNIV